MFKDLPLKRLSPRMEGEAARLEDRLGAPLLGVHEIAPAAFSDMPAALGLAVGFAHTRPQGGWLWVRSRKQRLDLGRISARGLAALGADPGRVMLVETRTATEALRAIDEAARSRAIGAVIAELDTADFTFTRRLSLAHETSATPVILVRSWRTEGATAAHNRWRVSAAPSAPNRLDPRAPGRARWQVTLERSREFPQRAGETFLMEMDDAPLRVRLVPALADGAPETRPHHALAG
ncbi:MAG: protein ImuA [Oceanicaulis sp. HLUCCA04]|nr:MAG: protein ImuA [Oceanicaulis sp. HLUCCA04]